MAEHYIVSENYEKGAEYSRLAERKAEKAASFTDAIAYAEKRVACLERLPEAEEVEKKIIDARTTLGLYLVQVNYHVESKEAVDPIVDLAVERNYKRRVSQIYTIIGAYNYIVEEDFPKAFKYLEDALKISEEINDILSILMANYWMVLGLTQICEFEKALFHLGKALEINVRANSLYGISILKSMISFWIYRLQGKVDLAYQTSDEALRIAEESGDIYSKAFAHWVHGSSYYHKGFIEEAERHFLKAHDLSERINLFSVYIMVNTFLGDTYFEIGEYQKAKDHYYKGILSSEHRRTPPPFDHHRTALARAKVMNNEMDIDLESLYHYENENKGKWLDGPLKRDIGEILLNIDNQHMDEAEDWIKKAIEADNRNGMIWYLGRDYALYAELFKRKGDQSKARENLNKAIEILKECGADGWVEKYEKELTSLS